jgi:hypothetical protein
MDQAGAAMEVGNDDEEKERAKTGYSLESSQPEPLKIPDRQLAKSILTIIT